MSIEIEVKNLSVIWTVIMKTYPRNEYPSILIEELGFPGVCAYFSYFCSKTVLTCTHNSGFEQN